MSTFYIFVLPRLIPEGVCMNPWLKMLGCVGAILVTKVIEAAANRELNRILTEVVTKGSKSTTIQKLK